MGIKVKVRRIKLNKQKIIKVVQPRFVEEIRNLEGAFIKTIASPVFDWNGTTLRKNKDRVSSPRNIMDLGKFADSLSVERKSDTVYHFVWGVDYAKHILFGTYKTLPRDWISYTMQQKPFINFKHTSNYQFRPNE